MGIVLGVFGLTACSGTSLKNYKAIKIIELQDYADVKVQGSDYTNVGLQAITKVVTGGKEAVDMANSREAVDVAVKNAKDEIDMILKKNANSIAFENVLFEGLFVELNSDGFLCAIVNSKENLLTIAHLYQHKVCRSQ